MMQTKNRDLPTSREKREKPKLSIFLKKENIFWPTILLMNDLCIIILTEKHMVKKY